MNFVFLPALLAAALPQVHIPTLTVDGSRVIVDADIAWITAPDPVDGVEVLQGSIFSGASAGSGMAASHDGRSPIIWRLPPGEYTVRAYGFPDDRLNPQRTSVDLVAVVTQSDRRRQIRESLNRLTLALFDVASARDALQQLNPTRAEIQDALTEGSAAAGIQ